MIIRESSRVERVAHISRLLVEGRAINAAEVAELVGVSTRTIQRDLSVIARVLPIYYDAGVWYYISQEDAISPF